MHACTTPRTRPQPRRAVAAAVLLTSIVATSACSNRTAPVTKPQPPPPTTAGSSSVPMPSAAGTTARTAEPEVNLPATPSIIEDTLTGTALDELNRRSPLRPAFFPLDSAELDAEARAAVNANAEVLKRNPQWVVSIEGHCDERGTAEYNLALGERRAQAAKTYLQSLGIAASRLETVSYGDESPFDSGHTEGAWSQNRRAHFVISSR
jgi:peptidoglycan-associated lipoprotein